MRSARNAGQRQRQRHRRTSRSIPGLGARVFTEFFYRVFLFGSTVSAQDVQADLAGVDYLSNVGGLNSIDTIDSLDRQDDLNSLDGPDVEPAYQVRESRRASLASPEVSAPGPFPRDRRWLQHSRKRIDRKKNNSHQR